MYINFGEYLQYAQSTRKVREIGEYIIKKRMQALVNKEEVPNDILTMILNSTRKHTALIMNNCVWGQVWLLSPLKCFVNRMQ